MNRLKRIFAIVGVVFLLGMYLIVFILGITANPATTDMLMAAVACTVIIPCLLYGMMLIARVLDNRDQNKNQEEDKK
ncbi:MAG: hypothetical protein PUF13_12420 [Lachnospiraceae bacterium]|nr:hypothetical protein [Lachnospiraceae bacterium]